MIILSIDLGKTCGVAVSVNGEIEHTQEYTHKGLLDFQIFVKETILLWQPELILIPFPTRFYYVMIAHAKLMGIVEAEADKFGVAVIETQDNVCKKVVLGKGNSKKEDIEAYYKDKFPEASEHEMDAVMFIDWYLKSV